MIVRLDPHIRHLYSLKRNVPCMEGAAGETERNV